MTTFEKAMTGDTRAIERYFFTNTGATRSDEESDIIFSRSITAREKLLRIAAMREGAGAACKHPIIVHIPFEALISNTDAIHARALGVQLS